MTLFFRRKRLFPVLQVTEDGALLVGVKALFQGGKKLNFSGLKIGGVRAGNSLIGSLRELLVFCEKMSE